MKFQNEITNSYQKGGSLAWIWIHQSLMDLMFWGRLFHNFGAIFSKALSPNVLDFTRISQRRFFDWPKISTRLILLNKFTEISRVQCYKCQLLLLWVYYDILALVLLCCNGWQKKIEVVELSLSPNALPKWWQQPWNLIIHVVQTCQSHISVGLSKHQFFFTARLLWLLCMMQMQFDL